MNVTGESFDYGPWRWLPVWEPGFTAAYFDQNGLYAFGRQPEAMHWNCGQLAVALRLLAEAEPLIAAMNRFGELYVAAIARRWCWRIGVKPTGTDRDAILVSVCEKAMRESKAQPDAFFYAHRGGRNAHGEVAELLEGFEPVKLEHPYWQEGAIETMLIDEVETIWSAIDQRDDWQPLYDKVESIRRVGQAHGKPPKPGGLLYAG